MHPVSTYDVSECPLTNPPAGPIDAGSSWPPAGRHTVLIAATISPGLSSPSPGIGSLLSPGSGGIVDVPTVLHRRCHQGRDESDDAAEQMDSVDQLMLEN